MTIFYIRHVAVNKEQDAHVLSSPPLSTMEFTELIKIKLIRNVGCLLDVFSSQPEGPGVIIVSAHVLCYESVRVKVSL